MSEFIQEVVEVVRYVERPSPTPWTVEPAGASQWMER